MARSSLKNIMNLLDAAKDGQTVEQSFLNDLKRSIEMTASKNKRPGSKTYKPSGMGCMRASYYTITGVVPEGEEPSYVLEGICNAGSDIHVRVQTAVMGMQGNDMDCEWVDVEQFVKDRNLTDLEVVDHTPTETKLYNKRYNISFLCDGIIKYKGEYYILELKTETSYKWTNRRDVDPKHHNQATCYSLCFGLDKVIFVYISRDMLDMKAFMLNVTGEMKNDLVGYITTCDDYITKNKVPPKPEDAGPRKCQYCGYRAQCRRDE